MSTTEIPEGGLYGAMGTEDSGLVPEVVATAEPALVAAPVPAGAGRFAGRRALVTGGGSGIGLAVVRRLLAEGAVVVAADLDPGAAVAEGAQGALCDVADEASVAGVAAAAEPLDLLVANAGMAPPARELADVTVEEVDHVLAINVRGTFLTLKHVVPGMVARGRGAVVVTASAAGLTGVNWMAAYCASKHAVVGLVRSVALDVAGDGVRVNTVCPGTVRTPMVATVLAAEPAILSRIRRAGTTLVPMDRQGEAEEVATVIAFLLSDEASFITGAAVPVDGGLTAGSPQRLVTRAVDPEL